MDIDPIDFCDAIDTESMVMELQKSYLEQGATHYSTAVEMCNNSFVSFHKLESSTSGDKRSLGDGSKFLKQGNVESMRDN
ncbi:hypothetical protein F2Q68_00035355 [Brassica cretica]|uniref:Uncharacterized protein n=1 Tax=Brassica cretica TaxID=69181 RepID=A0A8S9H0Z3_BRACR|nr:hypothetical protein F2Q68_00035355 [Brassica cretica]